MGGDIVWVTFSPIEQLVITKKYKKHSKKWYVGLIKKGKNFLSLLIKFGKREMSFNNVMSFLFTNYFLIGFLYYCYFNHKI